MPKEIVTLEDLAKFKSELLLGIKEILDTRQDPDTPKYLRTSDVRKILGLSASTIQSLRNNGKLPFVKVQGTIYYKPGDNNELFSSMGNKGINS
jgi:hypothetical protein